MNSRDLDNWIINGEGKPLSKTYDRQRDQRKAERETHEQRQRRLFAEQEARRIGDAQRKRYHNHILSVMPVQNGVQRMPNPSEFARRLNEAYQTITHDWTGYPTGNIAWTEAVSEVQGILRRNTRNVANNYARLMTQATNAGETDLKAIWERIAHYTDKDDVDLKGEIWKIMSLHYNQLF